MGSNPRATSTSASERAEAACDGWTLIALGLPAGLALFAVDTCRFLGFGRPLTTIGIFQWVCMLALMLLLGVTFGMFLAIALRATSVMFSRLRVKPRTKLSLQVAVLSSFVVIPVARSAFEGRAIRQLPVATWGPWVTGVMAIVGAVVLTRVWATICRSCHQRNDIRLRGLASVGMFGAIAVVILADLYLYRGLYLQLHYSLNTLAFLGFAGLAFLWFGPRIRALSPRVIAAASGALVVLCSALHGGFEFVIPDRCPGHFEYSARGVVLTRTLTDFDRDGYSSILAHGDESNFDPSRHPMAREIIGNGIDEDFAFGDLTSEDLERARARYRPNGDESAARGAIESSKPHIIFLSIDALRYDRVTNWDSNESPFHPLAEFFESSVVFDRAYTGSSFTSRSLRIALTGRFPGKSKGATVFERMKRVGYSTAICTTLTHYGIIREEGLTRGFDVKHMVPDGTDATQILPYGSTELTSEAVVDRAIEVLDSHKDGPLCLWTHLFDLHQWFVINDPSAPNQNGTCTDAELYDHFARACVAQVARFLAELDKRPRYRDAVVVLTSDHGEGLGFKGFRLHTYVVHTPVVHVPLAWRIPGVKARKIAKVVSLADICPSLASLAGIPPGDDPLSDGASLLPLITGAQVDHHPAAVFEDENRAVLYDGYKFDVGIREGRYALYDIDADRDEKSNLFMTEGFESLSRNMYLLYQASPVSPLSLE